MSEEPAAKRQRVDGEEDERTSYTKGIAAIKPEYVIERKEAVQDYNDEDEGGGVQERGGVDMNNTKKKRGQNKNRKLIQGRETVRICENIKGTGNPDDCKFGETCKREHDVQKYLESKPKDIPGVCPVYEAIGYCPVGIKCRWLGSHYENGVVVSKPDAVRGSLQETNRVIPDQQFKLQRKQYEFIRADQMIEYFSHEVEENRQKNEGQVKDNAAQYIEPPFKLAEKKRLYYDRAKVVSPLTTVGNLPYRRLMKTLGADVTFSEMALSLPLLQGAKSEWALPRAHQSEHGGFGVQIAGSKHWQVIKAAEVITDTCENISEINLNCGCPIDLLFRSGAGSALMDNPSRLLRMLKGMNYVSKDIPVTVKIRTGTRDKHPTAKTLVSRLIDDNQVAAITIHGRSRAQRYTRLADWEYIQQVGAQVKAQRDVRADDDTKEDTIVKPWIVGNGDVYSWKDWYDHIETANVDTVMVARGALIKPWIFEEVEARQYLDKSATERLALVEQFAKFGLDHWGSDEYGVNLTRRFLCEWLSFTHRYIPEGILEHLPAKINDRPPPFVGRNELETLLASNDYKDWIKISEMFLGPTSDGFEFVPKHKSNAYN